MINEVRNTVMAVLNKDNNGYVTPEEFNLFARQAQVELFEEYFYDYSQSVVLMNNRKYNTGYSDIPKQTEEVIDMFSLESAALANVLNVFTLPTDWYTLTSVKYNSIDVDNEWYNSTLCEVSPQSQVDIYYRGRVSSIQSVGSRLSGL